jgi:hypothetical protein
MDIDIEVANIAQGSTWFGYTKIPAVMRWKAKLDLLLESTVVSGCMVIHDSTTSTKGEDRGLHVGLFPLWGLFKGVSKNNLVPAGRLQSVPWYSADDLEE